MSNTVLSVVEAAQQLGVSPFTLRTWLRLRRLPYLRIGRRVVLDASDVERFKASHRVEAADATARSVRTR